MSNQVTGENGHGYRHQHYYDTQTRVCILCPAPDSAPVGRVLVIAMLNHSSEGTPTTSRVGREGASSARVSHSESTPCSAPLLLASRPVHGPHMPRPSAAAGRPLRSATRLAAFRLTAQPKWRPSATQRMGAPGRQRDGGKTIEMGNSENNSAVISPGSDLPKRVFEDAQGSIGHRIIAYL